MVDISDQDRDAFHPEYQHTQNPNTNTQTTSTALNIGKVFLYMFAGLLITALVAFGVGAIVAYGIGINGDYSEEIAENILMGYLIALVVSAVLLLVDMIIINVVILKGKHSILVPGIIYAVLVGVLFSMLTIVVDWRIIGMAFGVTALAFLIMSLIAFLSKGSMAPLLVVIIGLGIGVGLLALFNWLFMLISGSGFQALYWIVTFGIFALVIFITIFDLWRIKKIAENGQMNNNLALYCAFVMYTDFINVFIRVLYFLLIIFGKKR